MVARAMAGALMALAAAASAQAQTQTVTYTWTGMGTSVVDSSKCATYKMTIDVAVDGKTVKGILHQQGRPERKFETTLDDKGMFKTKPVIVSPAYWKTKAAGVPSDLVPSACGAKCLTTPS